MAPGFVKRNEKLLMVLLLTLIAPSFAFTGVMSWYFSYKGGAPLYEVFGETIGREDFRKLRQKMANYQKITLLRQWGPYGLTAWEGGATGEATLRHLMYTREAARLGITVGDDEGKELLRDAALDIIAWHQVMEESGWQGQFFDIYQKYQQRRPTVRLFLADYQAALQDRRFRLGMSVKQFEDILVENLIVEKLLGLVQEAAEVSEREIYDEYFTAEQKRAFDIVVVPVEHFVDEAQGAIDADYLQQVYEKKESELLIKPRLKLAVAKAKRNAFYAEIEEPAEEEILARYENDKMTRYRKRRPLPPPGDDPAAAAAPDEPRPLEEVRGLVIADLKRERARARETEALEEALARARDLDAEGKEWSLSEVVAGSPDKIEVIDIDWINENQLGVVDQRIRNPASLRH
ncbi:MAG: hypothetical protein ACE5GW_04885, partial [Planctomycetota bacterium]